MGQRGRTTERHGQTQEMDTTKGVILLVLGTLCLSTVPVLSKFVLMGMPSIHFSALWMVASSVWGLAWLFRNGITEPLRRLRRAWRPILLTGLFATGWVFFYFRGLERIDPATATFVINSRIVWAVLIGVVFLRERYTRGQLAGILAVAVGVFVIYSDVGRTAEALGILFVLLAALFFVIGNTIVKQAIPTAGVDLALLARFIFPALILVPISLAAGSPWQYLTAQNVALIAAGSLIGPSLSFLLIYTALQHLHLGVHTAFQSVSIVFGVILTYLVFGIVPSVSRLIGGAIVVVALVAVGWLSTRGRPAPVEDPAVKSVPAGPDTGST